MEDFYFLSHYVEISVLLCFALFFNLSADDSAKIELLELTVIPYMLCKRAIPLVSSEGVLFPSPPQPRIIIFTA